MTRFDKKYVWSCYVFGRGSMIFVQDFTPGGPLRRSLVSAVIPHAPMNLYKDRRHCMYVCHYSLLSVQVTNDQVSKFFGFLTMQRLLQAFSIYLYILFFKRPHCVSFRTKFLLVDMSSVKLCHIFTNWSRIYQITDREKTVF